METPEKRTPGSREYTPLMRLESLITDASDALEVAKVAPDIIEKEYTQIPYGRFGDGILAISARAEFGYLTRLQMQFMSAKNQDTKESFFLEKRIGEEPWRTVGKYTYTGDEALAFLDAQWPQALAENTPLRALVDRHDADPEKIESLFFDIFAPHARYSMTDHTHLYRELFPRDTDTVSVNTVALNRRQTFQTPAEIPTLERTRADIATPWQIGGRATALHFGVEMSPGSIWQTRWYADAKTGRAITMPIEDPEEFVRAYEMMLPRLVDEKLSQERGN